MCLSRGLLRFPSKMNFGVIDGFSEKCICPPVAELWPAAFYEEQHGGTSSVQFVLCPCGVSPPNYRRGPMASTAATGTYFSHGFINSTDLLLRGWNVSHLSHSLIPLCLQGYNTKKPAGLLQSKSKRNVIFFLYTVYASSVSHERKKQNINRTDPVFLFPSICLFTHQLTGQTHTGRVCNLCQSW